MCALAGFRLFGVPTQLACHAKLELEIGLEAAATRAPLEPAHGFEA